MKASIIIPSYNASERLYYNLLSLNAQCCDRSAFEVIVVDNGSIDDTRKLLLSFKANFDLKPIFIKENKGRAYARNCAIDKSNGDIIVCHDSDMIAEKDYVIKHIKAHAQEKTVVIGQSWSRIYTYFYKDFKGYLENNLINQHKKSGKNEIQKYRDLEPLITEEEILNGTCFNYSFKLHKYQSIEDTILHCFGCYLEGFAFPWCLFATNNCSAFKKDIIKAGAFDDAFITWGCEDLDLGYRLYKNGCHFIKDNNIASIHQEHPIDFSHSPLENVYYFTSKYNDLELLIFFYGHYANVNKNQINILYNELEGLRKDKDFAWFIELYRKLLINIRDVNDSKGKHKIIHERKELKQSIISREKYIGHALHSLIVDKKLFLTPQSFKALLKRVLGPDYFKLKI